MWLKDFSNHLQAVLALPLHSQVLNVMSARTAFEKYKT